MKILFVDAKSSTPYDGEIMRVEGIGGTEQSLVRVAQGLAEIHEVAVAQLGRRQSVAVAGVHYLPLEAPPFGGAAPDRVVVLRKHKLLPRYRRQFPQAKLYTWIHNWQKPEVALKRAWLARAKASVVAVSDAHQEASARVINGLVGRLASLLALTGGRVPVRRIYNPIDEALVPDATVVNPNQMIFLSTPNKGLVQVLETFASVRQRLPRMELLVAGATLESLRRDRAIAPALGQPGVRVLGRLPQQEMLEYVRSSLCVFYPQSVHPETFGLIFAEANAVGTPVLAHDFGSAREVLGGDEQLVNAADADAVAAKVAAWRDGSRPRVRAQPQFRASAVVAEWRRLLEGSQ